MTTNRRHFIAGSATALVLGPYRLPAGDCAGATCPDEIGKTYGGWRPGEMDLHFIHTGRGKNAFYIFPDGTTVVNDTGDFHYQRHRHDMPFMPIGCESLLGGEVVARYIRRLTPAKRLDYALVSHWHSDHVGEPALGHRLTPPALTPSHSQLSTTPIRPHW